MSDDFTGMPKPMPRPANPQPLRAPNSVAAEVLNTISPQAASTEMEAAVAEAITDWEGMTEAERLGIMVAGTFTAMEQARDKARDMVAVLEAENAQALMHLRILRGILTDMGTTYAKDTHALEQANEFLDGVEPVGSPETPDDETEDH